MRLDRYLSHVTPFSRSQAQKAIRGGRVAVDGRPVRQPTLAVSEAAKIELDGTAVRRPGHRYFMLNKPKGYVCATRDRQHSTVLELLDEPVIAGLHFAGRLDIDTTGLVLITDDGAWSHRITAPRWHCPKTYLATLTEPLTEAQSLRLSQGVLLRQESQPTRPAELARLSEYDIRLTLTEGRYHQVKRMLAAVGNRVIALHRESIAGLMLDAKLRPGEYRPLAPCEIEAV